MAFDLRSLQAESIPLNFLNPIDGTPLEKQGQLTPRDCLRALALMRYVNPRSELRIAGGRELQLRSLQPLGLYVANSLFIGDYLTTKGQSLTEDYQLVQDLGFTVTLAGDIPTDLPEIAELQAKSRDFGIVDRPAQGVLG